MIENQNEHLQNVELLGIPNLPVDTWSFKALLTSYADKVFHKEVEYP